MSRIRRWAPIAAIVASAAVAIVAILVVAPRLIVSDAIAYGRARGLNVSVARARLRLRTVTLEDVRLDLEGVSAIGARVRAISANWGYGGVVDPEIQGAELVLRGSPATINDEIAAWRKRHLGSARGPARRRRFHATDTSVDWSEPNGPGSSLRATLASAALSGEVLAVRDARGLVSSSALSVSFSGLGVDVATPSRRLGSVQIGELRVRGGIGENPPADFRPQVTAPSGGSRLWSAIRALEAKIAPLRALFEPGSEMRVQRFFVDASGGGLGPWTGTVTFSTDVTGFGLEPTTDDGTRPLVFRALIPAVAGRWRAEVRAAPASLWQLGVREGTWGLVDVSAATLEARGSLEVDPRDETLVVDGSIALRNGSIARSSIADGVVHGIELAARGLVTSAGEMNRWRVAGGTIELGKIRLTADGELEWGRDGREGALARLDLAWDLPTVSCEDGLRSIPRELTPRVAGMTLGGNLAAHGRFGFDDARPLATVVDLTIDQRCRVVHAPEALAVERFRVPFELQVYDSAGRSKPARFGPGTPGWVGYDAISPYVTDAILTCEDGGFFSHRGFSAAAIRGAMLANLRSRRFALGASTVTMQLAKNLFLNRKKQLSRKVQEAVLAVWLEQAMSKTELLELYLNVVELGPDLYGIGPAARHYFGRSAAELNAAEAMFLVSILPSPLRRHRMWEDGAPSPGYAAYVRSLLKIAHSRGMLDDDELADAVGSEIAFHRPGAPLPPTRPTSPRHGTERGDPDDAAYEPLQSPAE